MTGALVAVLAALQCERGQKDTPQASLKINKILKNCIYDHLQISKYTPSQKRTWDRSTSQA